MILAIYHKKSLLNTYCHRYLIDDTEKVNEELINEYWQNAEEIISKFNELGGGPEENEEEAYEWLEDISKLLTTGSLSSEARHYFIDDAMFEYQKPILSQSSSNET